MSYLRPTAVGLLAVAASILLAHNAPPVAAETAAAVAAGDTHTCALTTTGGVKCWGENDYGQVGDGTSGNIRTTPIDVSGLTSGVAAVTAGWEHTCALTTAGGLRCWGRNPWGQLGDGTHWNYRTTPVDVSGLTSGVAAVTASTSNHTCALTTTGGLKWWGNNDNGQLGDGTTTERTTPVDVSGLTSGVAAVEAGGAHSCAVRTAVGVKCWGRNVYGQLGDGTTTERWTPVDVSGLTSGVAAVEAGGAHSCAVRTAVGVKCWGRNVYGQLGDGTTTERWTPVDVTGFAPPVGGIAELPDTAKGSTDKVDSPADTSSPPAPPYIPLAGGAAALLTLTAGAWYARRRWGR